MVKENGIEMTDEERQALFEKVCDDIGSVLDGHPIHAVVPALTSLLSQAAFMAGMPQDVLMLYLMKSIGEVYKKAEEATSNEQEEPTASLH